MRVLKVKFDRTDLFYKYFDESFINSYKEKITEIGVDFLCLKDDVIDNVEADSKNNILIFIKSLIDKDVLIEEKICEIALEEVSAMPNFLFANVKNPNERKICEIIEVKNN